MGIGWHFGGGSIYTYGIKSLKFGYGSAGAVVMAAIVLLLSIQYIKKSMK